MCALSQSRAARAGFVVCSDVRLAAPWARVLWPWKLEPARRAFGLGCCWQEISFTRRPCWDMGTRPAHTDTVLVLSRLGSKQGACLSRQFAGAELRDRTRASSRPSWLWDFRLIII